MNDTFAIINSEAVHADSGSFPFWSAPAIDRF
jgi:hypothetical protein